MKRPRPPHRAMAEMTLDQAIRGATEHRDSRSNHPGRLP